MATPTGRILTVPKALRGRRVEDRFNAPPQPARGLALDGPNRFKDAQHQSSVDPGDRQLAYLRVRIYCERRFPLRAVLRVAPTTLMRRDIALRANLEGNRAGGLGAHPLLLRHLLVVSDLDRVLASFQQAPRFVRQLPGLGKRHKIDGAQSHRPRAPLERVAEYPGLGDRPLALRRGYL